MGWTKVEVVKPHRCDMPYFVTPEIETGDVIVCDCGQHWKCVGAFHGMQWDPLPKGVLNWEKCVKP